MWRAMVVAAVGVVGLAGCTRQDGLPRSSQPADVAPHGYTPKTRLAIFNWFEKHLKGSDQNVTEDIREEQEKDEDLLMLIMPVRLN